MSGLFKKVMTQRQRQYPESIKGACNVLIISFARKNVTIREWTSESASAGAPRRGSAKSISPIILWPPRAPNPLFRQTLLPWSSRQPSRLFPSLARGFLRKLDSQHHRVFAFLEKIHFPTVAVNDNPGQRQVQRLSTPSFLRCGERKICRDHPQTGGGPCAGDGSTTRSPCRLEEIDNFSPAGVDTMACLMRFSKA